MPGLGSTGSKFQLSAGWRYAAADRSYFNSRYNRDFTELWGPKIRLSTLDLTALHAALHAAEAGVGPPPAAAAP